jgi:dGTPase
MFKKNIAIFATQFSRTKGRLFNEKEDKNRSVYQRDRDRIIHSAAFRRLEHKTQVFVHHEGDHYRSRLTHTIEVSQIARTISRSLNLDEDLAEAISLAHDLGHTPFGHAGEDALNFSMRRHGGFDHNAHTLRIITNLEKKYENFDGLNLTWETLEGIVKHNGPFKKKYVPFAISDYISKGMDLELNTWCGPEAQVASLSDDIAYFSHDIEDGIRAGFFNVEDILKKFAILKTFMKSIYHNKYKKETRRVVNEIKRYIISKMIDDLISETKKNISLLDPRSADDIRKMKKPLVTFSKEMNSNICEIRSFLMNKMYRHWKINIMTNKAKNIVSDLFQLYFKEPDLLPLEWNAGIKKTNSNKARVVSDYIAGMTDRYAIREHKKLFDINKGWY